MTLLLPNPRQSVVSTGISSVSSVAESGFVWHLFSMTSAWMLEQPVVVHTRPAIDLNDEEFFQFCRVNRDLRMERSADGDILIMAPEAGSSGFGGGELFAAFWLWARQDGRGRLFGPSTGFTLPNRAIRSPDVAWVRNDRLDTLTDDQWNRFLPLCPDFVLELRSPSDSLRPLQDKMIEYRDNGAQLGWLLDPASKTVHVYKSGIEPEILHDPAMVSGEPLLAGFVLDVRQIWAAMARKA
jgi:Uma2 family endonuclease